MEERAEFPEAAYRLLGKTGLLSLPFPERYGGGGQPYEIYLQALEEIATAWPSVGVGVSVHALTVTVLGANGTEEQRQEWLPRMLSGEWLGAYCLSEPQAGSDVSAIQTRAVRDGDEYVLTGIKQWITNGSHADYYVVFARTGDDPKHGLSAFIVPDGTPGRELRQAGEEARHELRRHHHGDVRRRPGPGRPADRRGGLGHEGRALSAGRGPAGDRGGGHRHRPVRAQPLGRLRQGAGAVRPADRPVPGAAVHARRHGRGGGARPGDVPLCGPAQGRRQADQPTGQRSPS